MPQLFPSFELTRETDVQNIAGAIQATLDEANQLPIVDVKCLRLSARSKLLCLGAVYYTYDIVYISLLQYIYILYIYYSIYIYTLYNNDMLHISYMFFDASSRGIAASGCEISGYGFKGTSWPTSTRPRCASRGRCCPGSGTAECACGSSETTP